MLFEVTLDNSLALILFIATSMPEPQKRQSDTFC